MRAIWKGSVSFGLVNVPVKLTGATEAHELEAHQVHDADGGRIRYARTCESCGEVVAYGDISKQYEHDGHAVVLSDEDLEEISEAKNKTIEVLEFVPAEDIDPMLYDKPYFLEPDKSAKAYALLATTLANADRVALATFAMRGKTRLTALRVVGKENVIVAHTLRWPDEIRTPDFTLEEVEVKDAELEVAERVVASLANEFNADRYQDTYQGELRDLIESKVGEPEATADVSDLLEKLKASTKAKTAKKPTRKAS